MTSRNIKLSVKIIIVDKQSQVSSNETSDKRHNRNTNIDISIKNKLNCNKKFDESSKINYPDIDKNAVANNNSYSNKLTGQHITGIKNRNNNNSTNNSSRRDNIGIKNIIMDSRIKENIERQNIDNSIHDTINIIGYSPKMYIDYKIIYKVINAKNPVLEFIILTILNINNPHLHNIVCDLNNGEVYDGNKWISYSSLEISKMVCHDVINCIKDIIIGLTSDDGTTCLIPNHLLVNIKKIFNTREKLFPKIIVLFNKFRPMILNTRKLAHGYNNCIEKIKHTNDSSDTYNETIDQSSAKSKHKLDKTNNNSASTHKIKRKSKRDSSDSSDSSEEIVHQSSTKSKQKSPKTNKNSAKTHKIKQKSKRNSSDSSEEIVIKIRRR